MPICVRPALVVSSIVAYAYATASATDTRSIVADRVMQLTRAAVWTRIASTPVAFRTYHPQGMVKIGETLFVSSVDREGAAGHLFKMTLQGTLVADLKLGEGALFHPGGIDYDGSHVWVPVAEYRPDSRTIVYRVDPQAMTAAEVFRFDDHIGAIVHNVDDRSLHGVSWGSRRFYRWTLDADGRVTRGSSRAASPGTLNQSHYIDYQDCKYAGSGRMLCSGVAEIRQPSDAAPFRLGGLELIDLADGRALHQVPVLLWTSSGIDMTHNPMWIEPSAAGLRAYFMPEDDRSTLYIYDVEAR